MLNIVLDDIYSLYINYLLVNDLILKRKQRSLDKKIGINQPLSEVGFIKGFFNGGAVILGIYIRFCALSVFMQILQKLIYNSNVCYLFMNSIIFLNYKK